ncbi:VPA1262 family protein [Pseudomonas syringae]|uniref:VPA1262 family protein n=1 Tax=Pseudomonas syringae TaxID=317 RepID=UPI0021564B95|nr:VPA1262 family protein [Pseudomonas syringae]
MITTDNEPKGSEKDKEAQPTRIKNLLSKCADWGNGYFGNVRLKVLTVLDKQIHDRMILVRSNGRPVAGYHLSNSIQRANDNYPLLATPIPQDVLQQVFEYTDQIVQRAVHGDGKTAPNAKLIFDSSTTTGAEDDNRVEINSRFSFTDLPRAGDVFSWWLDDSDLSGLSGDDLKELLERKGIIKDGHLDEELFGSVPEKLWIEGLPLEDFNSAWDALGCILANSAAGQLYTADQGSLPSSLNAALLNYLMPTRGDAIQPRIKKIRLDLEHYRVKDLNTLLLSNTEPHYIFPYSPTDSSWGDYYALLLMWSRNPYELVSWLSRICSKPIEDLRSHVLAVEGFKRICLGLGFDKHADQIDALLSSDTDMVVWVGLHAFQDALKNGTLGIEALVKIDSLKDPRTVLCWLINEAHFVSSDIKPHLITKLTQSIEAPLTDNNLHELLQPVRGRLGRLHHLTPWILESLLVPMLEQKSIDAAQVSRKWLAELTAQWRVALENQDLYFTLLADGAFTDELAILTAYLAPSDQQVIFEGIRKVFDAAARTIYKPLSAQISWRSHIRAHEVNLWLFGLTRRIAVLVHDDVRQQLEELLLESEAIVERLPPCSSRSIISDELLTFVKGDPDQIKSHSLHQTIQTAIKPHH